MDTLQINLTPSLKEFVAGKVAAGGFGSPEEFVLSLLRQAQKREAWDKVEALVREGLESGPALPVDEKFWDDLHRELNERHPEAYDS